MKRTAAFTFIELLLVVIIAGALIGIALPKFSGFSDKLQLNSCGQEFVALMNFLIQRSVIEEKVMYLAIDPARNEYWARRTGETARLKSFTLPQGIRIEAEQNEIGFYPDGTVDKTTVTLSNRQHQKVNLTTIGVYSGVKASAE